MRSNPLHVINFIQTNDAFTVYFYLFLAFAMLYQCVQRVGLGLGTATPHAETLSPRLTKEVNVELCDE